MNEQLQNRLIWIISIAVPAVVAALFFLPGMHIGTDVSMLPALNAVINGTVSVLLITGVWFIKNGKQQQHRACMIAAFGLSALFLVSYVIYHSATESTPYGGEGWIRTVYFIILLTHIVLAAAILPLILITLSRALSKRFDKHRKIARITFPLWLYVSVTGVIVYLMISPYY
jgi:putative membrane protein